MIIITIIVIIIIYIYSANTVKLLALILLFITTGDAVDFHREHEDNPGNAMCLRLYQVIYGLFRLFSDN